MSPSHSVQTPPLHRRTDTFLLCYPVTKTNSETARLFHLSNQRCQMQTTGHLPTTSAPAQSAPPATQTETATSSSSAKRSKSLPEELICQEKPAQEPQKDAGKPPRQTSKTQKRPVISEDKVHTNMACSLLQTMSCY